MKLFLTVKSGTSWEFCLSYRTVSMVTGAPGVGFCLFYGFIFSCKGSHTDICPRLFSWKHIFCNMEEAYHAYKCQFRTSADKKENNFKEPWQDACKTSLSNIFSPYVTGVTSKKQEVVVLKQLKHFWQEGQVNSSSLKAEVIFDDQIAALYQGQCWFLWAQSALLTEVSFLL